MTEIDGLADLISDLGFKRLGWHRHVNSESGVIALFPSVPVHASGSAAQQKLEREFEERALAMHDSQIPVMPEAKAPVNTLASRLQTIRGD